MRCAGEDVPHSGASCRNPGGDAGGWGQAVPFWDTHGKVLGPKTLAGLGWVVGSQGASGMTSRHLA